MKKEKNVLHPKNQNLQKHATPKWTKNHIDIKNPEGATARCLFVHVKNKNETKRYKAKSPAIKQNQLLGMRKCSPC
jgi:hypothetical protein